MKQRKRHWEVYAADVMLIGSQYSVLLNDGNQPYSYQGDTWAVSEKQAINNVRHREMGDKVSQYSWYWYAKEVT